MSNIHILIAGGGTGGHISPGISLYEEFKQKGINVILLVGKKDISYSPLIKIDSKDIFYYSAPFFTKNIFKMPLFIINFAAKSFRAIMLLKRLNIDAVIGMGGYVSAPILIAAIIIKIPLFLCEPNSIPGKVTSKFAVKARKIFTAFNITRDYFKDKVKSKIINAGNPVRKDVFTKLTKEEAKKFFYLKHCKKVIFVIGGSQGAVQINELFLNIKKMYLNELKDVGIIWITGSQSYNRFKEALNEIEGNGSIYLSPFIDNIGLAYKASDLAISRSGAGGIMEFAAVGLASVLIPYPYAADNHQEKNAEVFEKSGASIRIRKDEAVPDKVGNIIIDLLNNSVQLSRMAEKARSLANINAARDIVEGVVEELKASELET